MKIYAVKTLVEGIDNNSCSVKLFKDFKAANDYANVEIDSYADDYDGNVVERAYDYFSMQAGDVYVTIEIEEHEIEL